MRLLILAMAMLLASCQTNSHLEDGYQFGDLTREAIRLQNKYCNGGDPVARALLMRLAVEVGTPLSAGVNICTVNVIKLFEAY